MELFLTVPEAASFLRSSIHTVRAWTFQKKLPVIKAGRKCLYRREDLEKFLMSNYHPAK